MDNQPCVQNMSPERSLVSRRMCSDACGLGERALRSPATAINMHESSLDCAFLSVFRAKCARVQGGRRGNELECNSSLDELGRFLYCNVEELDKELSNLQSYCLTT